MKNDKAAHPLEDSTSVVGSIRSSHLRLVGAFAVAAAIVAWLARPANEPATPTPAPVRAIAGVTTAASAAPSSPPRANEPAAASHPVTSNASATPLARLAPQPMPSGRAVLDAIPPLPPADTVRPAALAEVPPQPVPSTSASTPMPDVPAQPGAVTASAPTR